MSLGWIVGASIGAIVAGLLLAGGLEHLLWILKERARRQHAGRCGGTLDLRQRI